MVDNSNILRSDTNVSIRCAFTYTYVYVRIGLRSSDLFDAFHRLYIVCIMIGRRWIITSLNAFFRRFMYYAENGPNSRIERCLLNGNESSRQVIVTTESGSDGGVTTPRGLAIDYDANALYWCDNSLHKIEKVVLKLQGSIIGIILKCVAICDINRKDKQTNTCQSKWPWHLYWYLAIWRSG